MIADKRVFCPAVMDCGSIRVLDTETTGLDPYSDEIVQIAIIDGTGVVLLDSLVRPCFNTSWPEAQAIHGISPDDVRDAPTMAELHDDIVAALEGAEVIAGYNHIAFDIPFLRNAGIEIPECSFCDVMLDDTDLRAMKDGFGSDFYKWSTLKECADRYGIAFHAHDARSDAEATRRCMFEIAMDMWELSGPRIETFCKEDKGMEGDPYIKSVELLANASESALKYRILSMVKEVLATLEETPEVEDILESLDEYMERVHEDETNEVESTQAAISLINPEMDRDTTWKLIVSYGNALYDEWFVENVVEKHYSRSASHDQCNIECAMTKIIGGA